jgi:hypothetical protein
VDPSAGFYALAIQTEPRRPDVTNEQLWSVVRHVRTPLGLLALLLALLYLFLIAAGTMFALPAELRGLLVIVGILAFVLMGAAVIWLVVRHPTNLVFGEETQLRYQEMLFGSSDRSVPPRVIDALPAGPQPEPTEPASLKDGR